MVAIPEPPALSPARRQLRWRMTRPQRHRLLHGYPLAAAMPARRPDMFSDVAPSRSRGLIVGVLPHPYCNPAVSGCGFCTFPHQTFNAARAEAVIDAVGREVRTRLAAQPGTAGRPVDALYFGGGTANLSPAEPFRRLCRTLAESFDLRAAEVTLEGVPAYFVKKQPLLMDVLREEVPARHFRISMGVQTFAPERLEQMGRRGFGDAGTFAAVVEAAHARGFTASADLLFNLPHQTLAEMRRDLDRADALGLDHLGLYHLVLFRGLNTAWARDPHLVAGVPDNNAAAENWLALRARLVGGGWVQTTLTNFERAAFAGHPRRFVYEEFSFRPGRYDALGFGPGGISFAANAGFADAVKLVNRDDADAYLAAIEAGHCPWDRYFIYGPAELRVFYLVRRLAALSVDPAEYRRLLGTGPLDDFGAELTAAADEGLIELTPNAARLTPRGMFYADAVASVIARRPADPANHRPGSVRPPAPRPGDDNRHGFM